MKTETLKVLRNDFAPHGPDRKLVLIESDTCTELLVSPDSQDSGAVAFLQIANGMDANCVSLDFEAATAVRDVLSALILEALGGRP